MDPITAFFYKDRIPFRIYTQLLRLIQKKHHHLVMSKVFYFTVISNKAWYNSNYFNSIAYLIYDT